MFKTTDIFTHSEIIFSHYITVFSADETLSLAAETVLSAAKTFSLAAEMVLLAAKTFSLAAKTVLLAAESNSGAAEILFPADERVLFDKKECWLADFYLLAAIIRGKLTVSTADSRLRTTLTAGDAGISCQVTNRKAHQINSL